MLITNLEKTFKKNYVLQGLNLHLSAGQAHGLLGANGAGKSTLIKTMMRLVFADAGEISENAGLSLLPENPYLPLHLSAYQIVAHACRIQHIYKADDLLRQVRLKEDAWNKPMRNYSKGMKQRTAIAYALAGKEQWLILDEPMSGLDAMGRTQMLEVFHQRQQQGTGLLVCSHAVTDLVRLCQHIHIMAQGKICETIAIVEHDMQEVEHVEQRLKYWSGEDVVD